MPKSRKMFRSRRARRDGDRSAALDRGPPRAQANVGFPDRMTARLAYTDFRRINPGVVTALDTVYEMNGAFDPEWTGVGHQPRGYDPLAALYNRYRVMKCHVDIEVRQRAAHGIIGVLVPSNVQTALVTADVPYELPRAVTIPLTGSNQPISRVRATFDMAAILGQSRAQYAANEDVSAVVTGLPNEGIFLHVYVAQVDGATVLDAEYRITLVLETEFYDRKYDAPSSLAREVMELRELVARQVEEAGDDQPVVVPPLAQRIMSNIAPRRPAGRPG